MHPKREYASTALGRLNSDRGRHQRRGPRGTLLLRTVSSCLSGNGYRGRLILKDSVGLMVGIALFAHHDSQRSIRIEGVEEGRRPTRAPGWQRSNCEANIVQGCARDNFVTTTEHVDLLGVYLERVWES